MKTTLLILIAVVMVGCGATGKAMLPLPNGGGYLFYDPCAGELECPSVRRIK
ncbi:MAG: hypothetical protein HOH86_12655 [Verrucomicrobiales bacterium]|jgi:hypothetical protein|nr:hypothetical protein [Verrucomicrobiales bacterium]